jgi:succinoglycan biosynthesis protein ExoW
MAKINIIIPFYQREHGLLLRAVNSALGQQCADDLLVTIVDDGSPISARDELASIMGREQRLEIIEQPNAGPGAARNRGLASTAEDVEYIAFLDSDDRWLPGHLANGLIALRLGADFYFSNYFMWGSEQPRFVLGSSGPTGVSITGVADLFFNTGDLIEAVLRASPIGTPTVIFRRSIAPNLRFLPGLYAGEDSYLWIGLIKASRSVAFSIRCEVAVGRGVNIWGLKNWDSFEILRRTYHESKFRYRAIADYPLTPRQLQTAHAKLAENRKNFVATVLNRLRRVQRIDWVVLGQYLVDEPLLLIEFITAIARRLRHPSGSGGSRE